MAVTIDSPVDASVDNPNPLRVVGTASAADFVQVRLERSDGEVFNGSVFVDDPTMYTPVANGSDSINTVVDISQFGRLWQTGTERFVVEVEVVFTNSATASSQNFFAMHGNSNPSFWAAAVNGTGEPGFGIWDNAGTFIEMRSNASTVTDGDIWGLRFTVDRDNPKIEESINGGAWDELALSTDTLTGSTLPWGQLGTGDITIMPVCVGNLRPDVTANELTDGSVLSAKMTAHDGTPIIDIDMTRDADAGHADADPIVDALGQSWTKAGGTIERIRAAHLFTALGITDWVWDTPAMLPIAHTIAARTVTGTTGGTWATSTFTPLAVGAIAGSGNRFTQIGTTRYLWAGEVADPNAPTFAEIAAAVDITPDVRSVGGLEANHDRTPITVATSPQTRSFPGAVTREPQIIMYDREGDTSPYRDLFVVGTDAHLIVLPYGQPYVAGDRVKVYPARSAGNGSVFTAEAAPATFVIDLALTGDVTDTTIAP